MSLSIIIPLFNEEGNVDSLIDRLRSALDALNQPYEIILINDGSTDRTESMLIAHAAEDSRIKVISFRRNFGQTAAIMAGIDRATGDIVIPMDGDLQNDPKDIARLLTKIDEGYDVVSGWRRDRKDSEWRSLPSRLANRLISWISGVHLHDYGCTLKAYRREVIEDVRLYGEMHRFIPIYTTWQGGKVAEIEVTHHPRTSGRSKYGMNRIIKVVLDLIVVKFMADYATKPIYAFGGFGLMNFVISILAGMYSVYLKVFHNESFISTPLPLLVVLTFLVGMLSILMGLVAEISMRTYHESQGKPVYLVKTTRNFPE